MVLRLILSQETGSVYTQISPILCSDSGLMSYRQVANGVLNQEAEDGSPKKNNKFSIGICEGGGRRASVYKLNKKEKKIVFGFCKISQVETDGICVLIELLLDAKFEPLLTVPPSP